jgi:hypothetical protein
LKAYISICLNQVISVHASLGIIQRRLAVTDESKAWAVGLLDGWGGKPLAELVIQCTGSHLSCPKSCLKRLRGRDSPEMGEVRGAVAI